MCHLNEDVAFKQASDISGDVRSRQVRRQQTKLSQRKSHPYENP